MLFCFMCISTIVCAKLRDPTQPVGAPSYQELEDPRLAYNIKIDAILIGKNRSVATINGQHFSVGDRIKTLTITAIDKDGVHLADSRTGENFILNMIHYPVKTLPKEKENL